MQWLGFFDPADAFFVSVGHRSVQSLLQLSTTFASHCRRDDYFLTVFLEFLDGVFDAEVALVEGYDKVLFGKLRVECLELFLENLELVVGVFGKTVDYKEQRVRTFDVFEELVAKALAFACTFQKTRNIGNG